MGSAVSAATTTGPSAVGRHLSGVNVMGALCGMQTYFQLALGVHRYAASFTGLSKRAQTPDRGLAMCGQLG